VANRVAVMYAGRIVEYAEVGELFRRPQHPYTWGLLGSISRMDRPRQRRLAAITGQPPSLISLPAGCSFRPRCPHAFDRCRTERPDLAARSGAGHLDACFLPADEKLARRTAKPEAS
jgi:oligopeptide/dipeptide ABC transporter ATP-binding protein